MTRDEIKAEIARLKEEHARLDARVESFEAQVWMSPEDQIAQKECKKLKLKAKERIAELTDDLARLDASTQEKIADPSTPDELKAEIARLKEEHASYDARVESLETLVWLSPEDEVILRKYKKLKLKTKERMVALSDKLAAQEKA